MSSVRVAVTALTFWLTTSFYSVAFAQVLGGRGGDGVGIPGRGGSNVSAPEFDGPGGVAAIALLVSAGLIAYNRYKSK